MNKFGVYYNIIPIPDVYLFTTPVPANAEVLLHQVPLIPNQTHELVSVDVVCIKTIAIDGTNDMFVDLVVYDASAVADVSPHLLIGADDAAGDLETVVLDLKVPYNLYYGKTTLDAGDSVRAVLATTTPDTAGVGYFFIVGYRVKDVSGQ